MRAQLVVPSERFRNSGTDGVEPKRNEHTTKTLGLVAAESDGDTHVSTTITQPGDEVVEASVTVRAQSGTKHTRSVVNVDVFGNRTSAIAYGVLGEDEPITSVTTPVPTVTPEHVMGEGYWAWRTGQSWVEGLSGAKRGWSETRYDEAFGDPVESKVYLEGALTREEMMRTAGIDSTEATSGYRLTSDI
jgi:hypothetical protein